MADLVNNLYSFDEDSMQRLMKDLNYMFTHLDERNVKRLYTEYCNIQSEDGETIIDGPLLTMRKPDSSTIRLKMGWDASSSNFAFGLFTSDGDPSISLNSLGEAVFSGNVNTVKDIYIGNRLFLGWNGSTVIPPLAVLSTRGMYIMEPDTTKYMAAIYSTNISATTDQFYEFEMESSAPMNITSLNRMRLFMYAGYDGTNIASINSTDYMQLLAFNNKAYINSMAGGSTAIGTMIGNDDRSVFVGSYDDWYNKVISVTNVETNYSNRLKYYYMHNVRWSPPCTTAPNVISGCHLVSSTERIASTIGVRIYPLTTTIGFNQIDYNLTTALDFENYNDGTAMTSNDYLVIIAYISSTTILVSTGYSKVLFRLGNSSDVCWNFGTTGETYSAGWNIIKQPFTPDSIEGVPVMSAVNWVRYGWYGGHSTSHYVIIDYVGVIRANSTDATDFNPFVRDYNSTNYNQWESYSGVVMLENDGKPAIVQAPIDSVFEYDLWIRSAVQDFEFEVDNFSMLANFTPMLSAYIDSSNFVNARVSSGTLRLSGKINNSTFGRTVNCDAFLARTNTMTKLKRQLGTWTASFELTTDPMTYREVTMYNGPGSSWENFCALYIGHEDYDVGSRITGIRVKPYTD